MRVPSLSTTTAAVAAVAAATTATAATVTPAQQFWMDIGSNACDKLGAQLASDFDWAATDLGSDTGLPLDHYNASATVPYCKALSPGGEPQLQVDWDTDVLSSYETGTWSKATFIATLVAAPPIAKGGTANCTVTAYLDETAIVDDKGNYMNILDFNSNSKDVYDWVTYCATGKPFPKPDATPSANTEQFVADWQNAWNTGECDTFGAFLAENYTQLAPGAGVDPLNRAEAIASCKANKLGGDAAALSMFTTSTYTVGADTVVANYVMSASVKDPTTLKQCSVRARLNTLSHTFVNPATGMRVVDMYSSTASRDVRGDVTTKCHLG